MTTVQTFVPTQVFAKATWGAVWGTAVDYLRAVEWNHSAAPAMPWANLMFRYGTGKPAEAAAIAVHTKQDLAEKFIQIRGTFPDAAGTTTDDAAKKLINSDATFITDGILPGTPLTNTTDATTTAVDRVLSETELALEFDIFDAGEDYTIGGVCRVWTGFLPNTADAIRGADSGIQGFTARGLEFLLGRSAINGARCEGAIGREISAGAATATNAGYLDDATATFVTDGVVPGMIVRNLTDGTETTVTAVESETRLNLHTDIFAIGETYDVRHHLIDTMPVFNERYRRGGGARGNRSDTVNEFGVYEFSADGAVWTHEDIVNKLLAYFAPKGMTWELAASNDLLDALTSSHNLSGTDLKQALNHLIDRRRGLAWHVPNADFEPGDTVNIEVISRFETNITEGTLTITGNTKQVVVIGSDPDDPAHDLDKTDLEVIEDTSAYFNRIIVRGRGLTCFSASATDATLQKDWFGIGGTSTAPAANKLVHDPGGTFQTSGVRAGMFVKNTSQNLTSTVTAVDSEIQLSLADDIFPFIGTLYEIGLEAHYRHAAGGDADANDRARGTDKFDGVFTRFQLPADFDWQAGDGEGGAKQQALPQWTSGSYDATKTGGHWNRFKSLCRELPFKVGFDYHTYTAGAPTDRNPLNAEPEYLRPFALLKYDGKWYHAEDLRGIDEMRSRSCSIRMAERALGIVVEGRPAHLLAKNHWALANETNVDPLFDWDEMIITVCAETDDRPYRMKNVGSPGVNERPRTLTIDVPECEVHWVATNTVVGVGTDGALLKFTGAGATPNIIRNDSAMLQAVMAAARAWYSVERKVLTLGRKRLLMSLAPGTLVTTVDDDGDSIVIGTIVESRTYNALTGITSVRTGLGAMDFAAFATAGEQRVTRKGIAAIARDVRDLKRKDDHSPLREPDNPTAGVFHIVQDTFHLDIERDLNITGVGVGNTAQACVIPPHRQWYHFGITGVAAGITTLLLPSDAPATQAPRFVPERRSGIVKAISGAVSTSPPGGVATGKIELYPCRAVVADTKDDGMVNAPGWTDCAITLVLDDDNATNYKNGLGFEVADLGALGVKATGSADLTFDGSYAQVEAWVLFESPAVLTIPLGPGGSDILQLIVSMPNARFKWDSSSVKAYLGYRPLQT